MGIFDVFKKKDADVLDLSNGKEDIPIPTEIKEKLDGESSDVKVDPTTGDAISDTQTKSSTATSGGFASFFCNPTTSSSTAASSPSNTTVRAKIKASEILDKISKLSDRIELLERKIERLERR